jgi:hypothetical protein
MFPASAITRAAFRMAFASTCEASRLSFSHALRALDPAGSVAGVAVNPFAGAGNINDAYEQPGECISNGPVVYDVFNGHEVDICGFERGG